MRRGVALHRWPSLKADRLRKPAEFDSFPPGAACVAPGFLLNFSQCV